jgi:hypothetical protein
VAVGVLKGELGLAHPTQPVQRLRLDLDDRGRLPRVQAGVQLLQQLLAPREQWVAGWQVTMGPGRVAGSRSKTVGAASGGR